MIKLRLAIGILGFGASVFVISARAAEDCSDRYLKKLGLGTFSKPEGASKKEQTWSSEEYNERELSVQRRFKSALQQHLRKHGVGPEKNPMPVDVDRWTTDFYNSSKETQLYRDQISNLQLHHGNLYARHLSIAELKTDKNFEFSKSGVRATIFKGDGRSVAIARDKELVALNPDCKVDSVTIENKFHLLYITGPMCSQILTLKSAKPEQLSQVVLNLGGKKEMDSQARPVNPDDVVEIEKACNSYGGDFAKIKSPDPLPASDVKVKP